jgi:hypothetical protein
LPVQELDGGKSVLLPQIFHRRIVHLTPPMTGKRPDCALSLGCTRTPKIAIPPAMFLISPAPANDQILRAGWCIKTFAHFLPHFIYVISYL